MDLDDYIACICEGAAEQAIMELLLDNGRLIFTREQLLEEKLIRTRGARSFEREFLRKGFEKKITVLRILDSRKANFKLSKAYEHKIRVINIITAPEIEMLIILNENKYQEFKNSNIKPSKFCKTKLKISNVKNYHFVKSYFSNVDQLVECIREYKRVSQNRKGEHGLFDLLKN
jgi:hypothetical protein